MTNNRLARRIQGPRSSIMSELVRLGQQLAADGKQVINLAPGIPDYPAPEFLTAAAAAAITGGDNSYGNSWGDARLRKAIAGRFNGLYGTTFDPETETTVTAGASAALNAIFLAFLNPGDRVIVFEPFFENFAPQIALAGAVPRFVPLLEPDWTIDEKALGKAFTKRTKMVLLNTPNNPTGRVFSPEELELIARYCRKHDVLVVSDETYEPFTYGVKHVPIATLPGMRERTLTIGSISKVFNVSGWRIGDVLAPRNLTDAVRLVNNLSLGAPVPLQVACLTAMARYDDFVRDIVAQHAPLRDTLCSALTEAGWKLRLPEGTFSVLAQAPVGSDSLDICKRLLNDAQLLAVPGASFFRAENAYVRFCFARRRETIDEACRLIKAAKLA